MKTKHTNNANAMSNWAYYSLLMVIGIAQQFYIFGRHYFEKVIDNG
jgi:hypothetical protein